MCDEWKDADIAAHFRLLYASDFSVTVSRP